MGFLEGEKNNKSSDLSEERDLINFIEQSGKYKEQLLGIIQKNAELKAENNKLKEVSKVIPRITHDINNLLSPILSCVELIEKEELDSEVLNKNLNIIKLCSQDGLYLTSKIKTIIKGCISEKEKEVFLIDDLIDDVINFQKSKLETEKNKKITFMNQSNSGAIIKASAPLLRDIINNIINNAIDSIGTEGKITVLTKIKNANVVIKITDTGKGMTEEIKNKIFDPFFTTKGEKGLGVGLSMAKKIIMCHNGSMKVISKVDYGTSFIIELPQYTIPDVKNIEKSLIDQKNIKFCGNILLIDDNKQVASVVGDLLKSITNCKIISSEGYDVEEIVEKNIIDIVLCDYSMPDRSGLDIAKIIKDKNKNIYFCLLTGLIGKFKNGKINNVDYILNKPVNIKQINEMLIDYSIKIQSA